ncbi:ATP-dependent helicase [Terrimonas sp.]|uniref:DEAD/DEAH box helicase n=1 Tax=Terrimonas sp. TaxID=1914338 RepID=UPI000D5127ED|nr:DEAD/DEAH box helicase [Terrimonas sp.]PVD51188.1 ATP-dependent helicase [Terrimonas sp.]
MDKKELIILQISPGDFLSASPVINKLNIVKKGTNINLTTEVLDWSLVRKIFRDAPKPFRDVLMDCCEEAIVEQKQHIKHLHSVQRTDIGWDAFFSKNIAAYWHKAFESLKPYFSLVKWYQKKPQPGKKSFLSGPCSFSTFRPSLQFDVHKKNDLLSLHCNVVLNGISYALSTFNRFEFLLESKSEYFILAYRDYVMLEKIKALPVDRYASEPQEFAKHILADIEKNYTVNRNDHFPVNELVIKPINRLLLSELNNAFLMLTPQWVYDGTLIDGAYKETFEIVKDGESVIIKRDKTAEDDFVKTLIALHPNFANQRNGYYYLSFADAQKKQWFMKVYHQLLQMDIEIVGMDMLKHFRYSPHEALTEMEPVRESERWIVYEMDISFGKEKVPLAELQKMLLAGQKALLLKDGSLGVLGDVWMQQYASIVKHGKITNNEIEVLRWMAVATQESNAPLKEAVQKSWWQKWQQWQREDGLQYALPGSLNVSLRPYQQKGYEWLLLLNEIGAGACLADDMGLGKTLQSIAAIVSYITQQPSSKNIIICPSSLIYNWQKEFERFAPAIQTIVYHGVNRKKEILTEPEHQVIITTYSTMRNDVDDIAQQGYGMAVIDESHNIKNPSTQIAQAVMKIRADFRLALSGTPVVNNTFDLYSQLNFVVPGLFGSREFFKREYADPIDSWQDEEKVIALKKLTAPFILRRTKEQVAKDLPDKTESILWCDMNGLQRSVYEDILQQTRKSIFLEVEKNGLSKSKFSILQGMTKLRQVCSSPLLLPEDDKQVPCSESVKMQVLMDELTNILSSHKALVFSQFSSMLHLLAEECGKRGFDYYHFDGQTPPVKRAEMVEAFQQPGNTVPLFLISLKAGNTGLTLTAADYVFLFDPWWNTAVEDQAVDRTHRIGQTKNVFAYKMICKDTIEEKIINLQQKKKKLSEDLVSADEGFIQSLTEEDVAYLFG